MGQRTDTKQFSQASDGLPQRTTDQQDIATRANGYGEGIVNPMYMKGFTRVREGSQFLVTSPTPGTGLATIAAPTTLADTSPFIYIRNKNSATDPQAKWIFVDYVMLTCTAAGTAGASLHCAIKTDNDRAALPTGGSTLTPVNCGTNASRQIGADIFAGPLVASAATSAVRLFGHRIFKTAIPAVNDVYIINFGGQECVVPTTTTQVVYNHAEIGLAPGTVGLVHLWLPSQSAASSYEVEVSLSER